MIERRNIEILYSCLCEVISYLPIPLEQLNDDDIHKILSDLEGDYISFLYPNNLLLLFNESLICKEQLLLLLELYKSIDTIESSKWSVLDYKVFDKWADIRNLCSLHLIKVTKYDDD